MQNIFWERFPSIIIYFSILMGIFLTFKGQIKILSMRNKRSKMLETPKKGILYSNSAIKHIRMVVEAAAFQRFSFSEYLYLTGIFFMLSFLIFFSVLGFRAIFIAFPFACIPYLMLRIRLENLRYKGSNEAEPLVSGILNFYRVNHFNIYEAMEAIVREDNYNLKITKQQIFKLLMELRNTKNPIEMKISTDKFAYGVKTNWCNMLSQCIYAAVSEGMNITASLEDIMEQLKEARKLAEEKKRLNAESSRLIQILIPIAYTCSFFIGVKYLGISFKDMLHNQFFTQTGALLIAAILFLSVLNFLLVDMVKKGKFDF